MRKKPDSPLARKEPDYLVSEDVNGKFLWKAVATNGLPKGLILITGSTGSGKTSFLNALFQELLKTLKNASRRNYKPHIITVGDPIETDLYSAEDQKAHTDLPFRFTARTLRRDVESIEWATLDALRQTPSAFIISELREDDEFRAALTFAGTGHLVIATAHATSLVDAMARLMSVENIVSASGRALLGQRLAAVIYLQPYRFSGVRRVSRRMAQKAPIEAYQLKLCRIWRGNTTGRRAFVSDGLSSLHVAGPTHSDQQPAGVLGYYRSAELLRDEMQPGAVGCISGEDLRWKHLFQVAHRLDLFQDQD